MTLNISNHPHLAALLTDEQPPFYKAESPLTRRQIARRDGIRHLPASELSEIRRRAYNKGVRDGLAKGRRIGARDVRETVAAEKMKPLPPHTCAGRCGAREFSRYLPTGWSECGKGRYGLLLAWCPSCVAKRLHRVPPPAEEGAIDG